jgi:CRP-like cAMP-binding protein
MVRPKNPHATGNHLLDRLPMVELDALLKDAQWVKFGVREQVADLGREGGPVYFPTHGVYSLLLPLSEEPPVEVAVVDSEGMLGLPVVLGVDSSPLRAITQVAGECVRVAPDRFRSALHAGGVLDALVRRFLAVSLQSAHQNIACNLRHTVEERLCRWLLSVHDRTDNDEFEITQELMSEVVGASRQKVTVVAGRLQAAGHITYQRGRVRVVDRKGLEATSCECYRVLRNAYELLTG